MNITVNAVHNGCVMASASADSFAGAVRLVRVLSRVLFPHLWQEFQFIEAPEGMASR